MACASRAFDEVLDDGRPDRAGEIIARGGDRDRDAAPAGDHCDKSAITGPKVAEAPNPIST